MAGAPTKFKKWQPLKPGDIVDVIAPGFPTTNEELEGGIRFLKSLGLVPRVPADLFGPSVVCSNSISARVNHIKKALAARDSHVIWCLRGGYGAIQLIPEVAKLKKPSAVKLLIGYSDVTTLFTHWVQKWGFPVLHAPLLDRLGKGDLPIDQVDQLVHIVFGQKHSVLYNSLTPLNAAAKKVGKVSGAVVGGNLIVVSSNVGTPYVLRPQGKIVFFEDVGERGYRIDRKLRQLSQSGFFKGVKAVVLGPFNGGEDKDGISRVMDVWKDFAASVKFPVLSGIPAGHGHEQYPVPFGTSAVLKTGAGGSIEIQVGSAVNSAASAKSKPENKRRA